MIAFRSTRYYIGTFRSQKNRLLSVYYNLFAADSCILMSRESEINNPSNSSSTEIFVVRPLCKYLRHKRSLCGIYIFPL